MLAFAAVLAMGLVLLFAVSHLGGCKIQPYDATTGKPFGAPQSGLDAHPTISPAGNPVTEKPTAKLDVDRIELTGGQVAQSVGHDIGGLWGGLLGLVGGILVGHVNAKRLQLQKKQDGN